MILFSGEKQGYAGVALYSKQKPLSVKFGLGIKEHDSEGRIITAEYEKFYLVTTYVPNAGAFQNEHIQKEYLQLRYFKL